jgi:DNA topoisomerase-1
LGTDPKSGKPLSVRLGRYGPHAQIGTREDEEKPTFAGFRPGQSLELITLEEALELFKLPRELGVTPEGEKVFAAVGRFGPYIRFDNKFVSLKDIDPHEVTLEQALVLVAEKKEFEANRIIQTFEGSEIQVLRGRYGPYITDGNKNARIPKDREPESLILAECEELIAAAPDRKRGKKKATGKKKTGKKRASKKKTAKKKTTKKMNHGHKTVI